MNPAVVLVEVVEEAVETPAASGHLLFFRQKRTRNPADDELSAEDIARGLYFVPLDELGEGTEDDGIPFLDDPWRDHE